VAGAELEVRIKHVALFAGLVRGMTLPMAENEMQRLSLCIADSMMASISAKAFGIGV